MLEFTDKLIKKLKLNIEYQNLRVFGLKPSKYVHKIYTEMYKEIKEELGL